MKEKTVEEVKNAVKKISQSGVYEALICDDGTVFITDGVEEFEYPSVEDAERNFKIF